MIPAYEVIDKMNFSFMTLFLFYPCFCEANLLQLDHMLEEH